MKALAFSALSILKVKCIAPHDKWSANEMPGWRRERAKHVQKFKINPTRKLGGRAGL